MLVLCGGTSGDGGGGASGGIVMVVVVVVVMVVMVVELVIRLTFPFEVSRPVSDISLEPSFSLTPGRVCVGSTPQH